MNLAGPVYKFVNEFLFDREKFLELYDFFRNFTL